MAVALNRVIVKVQAQYPYPVFSFTFMSECGMTCLAFDCGIEEELCFAVCFQ